MYFLRDMPRDHSYKSRDIAPHSLSFGIQYVSRKLPELKTFKEYPAYLSLTHLHRFPILPQILIHTHTVLDESNF